jgi:hypothetical protein
VRVVLSLHVGVGRHALDAIAIRRPVARLRMIERREPEGGPVERDRIALNGPTSDEEADNHRWACLRMDGGRKETHSHAASGS